MVMLLPRTLPAQPRDLPSTVRELLPWLSDAEQSTLVTGGELTQTYLDAPSVRLAPMFRADLSAEIGAVGPTIGVESLFLIETPQRFRTATASMVIGEASVPVELYRRLQAFSTMEGIEYYSASRERMRVLFHESFVIAGPEDRQRLPDPVATAVPPSDRLHVFQRDSSFGRNVLEISYRTNARAVHLRMRTLTRMYYQGVVPAVGPGDFEVHLLIVPLDTHLLLYGNAAARPATLLGLDARVQTSLHNRLVALANWLGEG